MKLLLDAMYSPDVAARLRRRGHDAVAIGERPDLVVMGDAELLAAMAEDGRTIVTANVLDFVPLYRRALAEGREPASLFLATDLPLDAAGVARLVATLEQVLESEPEAAGGPVANVRARLGRSRM